MADEPLDRQVLREIRERLKQSRAAVDEYHRLQAALEALASAALEDRVPARAPRSKTAPTKPRARRGANRDKALQVISDRPGVTLAELAAATGIAKNVLYSLTRSLTQRGQIERVELPGNTFGFRIPEPTDNSGAPVDSNGGAAQAAPTARRTRRTRSQPAETGEAGSATEQAGDEPNASTEPAPA